MTVSGLRRGNNKSCGCLNDERADITGHVFGRLTALGRVVNKVGQGPVYLCRCECGREKAVEKARLTGGGTKSCGCRPSNRTHGQWHSPEYKVWSGMKGRCDNPANVAYKNYGGRGICYCSAWTDFENFYQDMGPRPSPRHSLDRIDNCGDYGPSNCRWALPKVQHTNKRVNLNLSYRGETKPLSVWVETLGLNRNTVNKRLRLGWSVERAFEAPIQSKFSSPGRRG